MLLEFEAIGTKWDIDVPQLPESVSEEQVARAVHSRIETFDKTYSRFKSDSWVGKARVPGTYQLPEDALPLFNFYQKLYQLTDGVFTPLIGRALEQAGYDTEYSLKPQEMSTVPTWDECLEIKGGKLIVKQPAVLDFGAAGKGYLVDIVGTLLGQFGINLFCIDAGGDILYRGSAPLEVGLEHPEKFDEAVGVVRLNSGSICGSSGNRRKWDKYHHIINPRTKTSPLEILATWVVAETALMADGLATALLLGDVKRLRPNFNFEYVIVYKDYTFEKSANFPGTIFIENK